MIDREKVINELVSYIESALSVDHNYVDCIPTDLLQYAVALLKEQKPKPSESRRKQPCPKCGTPHPETWFGCGPKSTVYIRCRSCDFEITGDTEIAAIRVWNAEQREDTP